QIVSDHIGHDVVANARGSERYGQSPRAPSGEALANEIHLRDVEPGAQQTIVQLEELVGPDGAFGRSGETRGAAREENPDFVAFAHAAGDESDTRGRFERAGAGHRMV